MICLPRGAMLIASAHATDSRVSTPRATDIRQLRRAFAWRRGGRVFRSERKACELRPVLGSPVSGEITFAEITARPDTLAVVHFAMTFRALRMIAGTMQNENRRALCTSRMARALL